MDLRTCLATLLIAQQALADESITAEVFAARCTDAGGELTLVDNLRVVGGAAELAECHVTAGGYQLEIEEAELSCTGFIRMLGEPDGAIRVERSVLFEPQESDGFAHVLIRAHRVHLEAATFDFSGTVSLETGAKDGGEMDLESTRVRSRSSNVHIGASGNTHGGRNTIHNSELVGSVDISISASQRAEQGRGRVNLETSALLSSGTITIETGDQGRTDVSDSRITSSQDVQIQSGGRTRVRGNRFETGGEVIIQGPRCIARHNIPDLQCRN